MSVKVKQEWGKQRAVWSLAEEQVLMDLFDKARHDPELRTKKGLKPCGWEVVVEEVNNRCKSTFNIDQLRSKSSRLMMDYELFEDVGGERSLTEEAWDKVIESMPENAKRLAQFKECGFPLADICRRISLGKDELPEDRPWASSVVGTKRPSPSDEELPEAKKSRDEVKTGVDGWGIQEEKLLMFLCWRAKTDKEKEGTEPWLEVTNMLNKNSQTNFNQEQVKSKYLQVMQEYEQFKRATGFTGATGTAPKYKKDWELLMKERPDCSVELEKLMKKGGFPHVEVCSLIKGDKATDNVEPASVTEYLATGALQKVNSTKALPHILPATTNIITVKPSATGAKPAVTAAVTPVVAPAAAAVAPAVFTQELHDNMNMFLKTATAYLVMLIDDHNKGSGM